MIDTPSAAFREAARQAAAAAGQFLTNDALDALVAAADADEGMRYLTRYAPEPPQSLVAQKLAPFLAAEAKPGATAGVSKYGAETAGLAPEVFNALPVTKRLSLAREYARTHGGEGQKGGATSKEKRIAADLHGARLRLHSLSGEARDAQAKRIAALESELAEARAR